MPNPIESYALIGDCESAALVSRDGSIDWLCWPRFDSGALFAALLGDRHNGQWSLAPSDKAVCKRRYRDRTLILDTEFETTAGQAVVTDFMPLKTQSNNHLVRIVRGVRGQVRMRLAIAFRFDYGSIVPWVTKGATGHEIKAVAGPDMALLRADVPLVAEGLCHFSEFSVAEGECVSFVLSFGSSFSAPPKPVDPECALRRTERAWRDWCENYKESGQYADQVLRSLITLKALTYKPTGGLVAAPTTSLPEVIGGERNWDYRYCWLRDTTFTLLALLNSGFTQEAIAWQQWLQRAVAGEPASVQIMYGLGGERRLPEWEVPWLAGYEASSPVRIGNAAAGQLQLDIYGEVMDALYHAQLRGLTAPGSSWDLQCKLVEHLEAIWQQPDEGIWEVRGGRRHFTHSKVLEWVAFDRAVRSMETFGLEGPIDRWRALRDRIHRLVLEHGYDSERGAFVQSFGSKTLDASALLIPLVGFLPATDPRVLSTIAAIERELMSDGLIRRYDSHSGADGLRGDEGAFLACSFWFADNLVLTGQREKAKAMFERLLALGNDVGLFAEEYDTRAGRMLGNFPQAFSHVALINTAHNLDEAEKPAEQRSGKAEAIGPRATSDNERQEP